MKKLVGLLFLASGIIACQNENKDNKQTDSTAVQANADSLTYKYDSIKVYSKIVVPVSEKSKDTTKASVTYPVFPSQKINEFIQLNALKSDNPDQPDYKSYKEVTDRFIKDFDDYQKQNKDDHKTWSKEITIRVLPQRKNYLGLKYTFVDYAGGAHFNSAFIYQNYNPQTNHQITLDSLIKPGSMPKLTAIAEGIFRKQEKLTPTQSLAEGYFFENNKFRLNDNFTITDKGLKFLYNQYEIKSFAEGITELLIPYDAIKEILQPNPVLPAFK